MNEDDALRLSDQIDSLRVAVTELAESIKSSEVMVRESRAAARAAAASAEAAERSNRNWKRVAIVGSVVGVLALGAAGGAMYGVMENRDNKADTADVRELAQQVCPLYSYVLDAFNRAPNLPTASAEENARRIEGIAVIEGRYKATGCQPPLPPR